MKKVTNKLSRKQLNQLYKSFDCSTWKNKIGELALSTENNEIIISDDYINLLLKEGTKEQLSLVTSKEFGIILPKEDKGIIDRVKTFEDALNIVGIEDEDDYILLNYKGKNVGILAQVASLKLSIIAKALNEGWIPDWNNSSQYKHYPWFKADGSGSGWVYGDYDDWDSVSYVGSRLTFKTRELAEYSGRQFIDLYSAMFKLS